MTPATPKQANVKNASYSLLQKEADRAANGASHVQNMPEPPAPCGTVLQDCPEYRMFERLSMLV